MDILIAVAVLGGMSLLFGLILAAASKVFYVETDPRLEKLNDCLPCANCGGCGYAGCSSYAEAVLSGEASIDKCNSGGNEAAQAMAAIMGVEAVNVTRKVALVRCSTNKFIEFHPPSGSKRPVELPKGWHSTCAARNALSAATRRKIESCFIRGSWLCRVCRNSKGRSDCSRQQEPVCLRQSIFYWCRCFHPQCTAL